ncbi:MAG: hypothetical protein ABJH98_02965 [Reichenbachiella sp.]|uniref:hypothetical protein n=1 Tax=Reichenbachiella sp. TaxID=2184521 RepID=UPI00329A42AF
MTYIENQNILLISPEAWGQNFVSKHHYAIELSNKNMVYFLNPPSAGFQTKKINDQLITVDYSPLFKGLRKLPTFLNQWLIKKEIQHLEKKLHTTFDVIWNFDSSRFFNLNLFSNKLKICHIVDMAENIQRNLLAQTSDICFCTSDFIVKELNPFNQNVHKINHGYHSNAEYYDIEEGFNSNIQVGYVGNLSRKAIDWPNIFSIIENHPNCEFNFIGNYKKSNLSDQNLNSETLDRLNSFKNVQLLGPKNSQLIPSYLKKFDILLCAYKIENKEDVQQHSNLHKTMEYLGSGKVIVSSYSDEYKNNKELLEMAMPNEDIVIKFEQVVNNITLYNSQEKQKERITFALSNSYKNQLKKINLILKKIT